MTSRDSISFLFDRASPALIAVIHVGALPGTPRSQRPVDALAKEAVREAKLLADAGVDALIVENMHDVPYLNRRVGPEIVAAMTAICSAVRSAMTLPIGVQILAGANREAMAVAQACGLQFIRAEGFVFLHVADEGLMPEADAGPLLRYRRMIGADHVAVLTDVKKKHAAHAITADVDIVETAKAAEFFGADGVIVTGVATGRAADPAEVAAVRQGVDCTVLVGSGVTPETVSQLAPHAHGLIVGSYLKRDGHWANEVDPARVAAMVRQLKSAETHFR